VKVCSVHCMLLEPERTVHCGARFAQQTPVETPLDADAAVALLCDWWRCFTSETAL